jgi:uncharacterized protein (DUF2342 family)
MSLLESLDAVAHASGDDAIDWDAVTEAAKGVTDPGDLAVSPEMRAGYAADVRAARTAVREVSGVDFDVPTALELQNRHHWIDANVATFRRAFEPLNHPGGVLPGVARVVNTATTAGALSFIARNVLGQYDPLLLADGDDHALYFVHPNVVRASEKLDVPFERFRRWIAFHEVTHAAEFGAAPWLDDYLEGRLQEGVQDLGEYRFDASAFRELQNAMTAVEGYAELLMDEAFDRDATDLRRKLDARRSGGDPLTKLVRRLLGFQLKREQYERGRRFFEHVARERGLEATARVWERPENLPSGDEFDAPDRWLARVPEA